MRVVLAGQNITPYVDEFSLDIHDTLAQGPGVQGGAVGRASTCTFTTSLGPAALAVGAGQSITAPSLVRQGEIQIYDQNDGLIYAGYVGKLSDKTERTRCYTEVTCYDYWQHLDRIIVNQTYDGQTDLFMINDLLNRYAGWIDRSLLPTVPNLLFGPRVFRNLSLQKAIQRIVDAVGWSVWITYEKKIHYVNPVQAPSAPFRLSTSPDFHTSFDLEVISYEIDDTSAINRVICYGGRHLSNDTIQDLSPFATGTNTIFPLPYYPRKASDGQYHVKINHGSDLILGFDGASTAKGANVLKPKGKCDVLLNTSAHVLTFAVPPPKGSQVTMKYRYELPLIVTIVDKASYAYYGQYLDATISDETIVETSIAIQRCNVLLLEQSRGLTTIKLITWKSGLTAGMLLPVHHTIRGIDTAFMIQEVHPIPKGGGFFAYEVTCGAWNWNLTDVLVHLAHLTTQQDDQDHESINATNANQFSEAIKISVTAATKTYAPSGTYYARLAPANDGRDAYPHFSTIGS